MKTQVYHRHMTVVVILVLAVRASSGNKLKQHNPVHDEYCESETFSPKCWKSEIIVMDSAFYGRMQIGRCVEADLGYLGCSKDVLHLLDKRCSGQQECEIRVPDSELDDTEPCFKELKVYLETRYACVTATSVKEHLCKSLDSVPVDTNPRYLTRKSDDNTNCKPGRRPLVLEAQPGQQINLTLIDFSSRREVPNTSPNFSNQKPNRCVKYGHIHEKGIQQNVTICGRGAEREIHLYESKSHRVEIVADWDTSNHFVIRYQASGCADLRKPRDAWMKRDGDAVVVGCEETRQTWHLKCTNNQWSGVIGNCTQHLVAAKKSARLQESDMPVPHSVAIVIIVGVALFICFVIVAIGIVFLNRYKQKWCSREKMQIRYNNVQTDESDSQKMASMKGKNQQQTYQTRNQYLHRPIWQSPLPKPGNNNTHAPDCPHDVSGGPGYGGSLANEDHHYNKSMRSTTDSESQRYFILDREAVVGGVVGPKDVSGSDLVV